MQGQSYITEEKARGFASVFTQQAAVVSASRVLRDCRYVHIDLHAGCGHNRDVDVIGSPILFTQIARRHRLDYLMLCAEIDKASVKELGRLLEDDHRSFPFWSDNGDLCDAVPDILRQHGIEPSNAIGSVLIDPNGFVNQIPWAALSRLFSTCGRLDVLFNFPGTAFSRNRGHQDHVSIDQLPQLLNKKHWFVREPLPTHKFTLCVGRNTDKLNTPSRTSKPFALWDSRDGKRFRRKAMCTSEEMARASCDSQLELNFG